MIPEDFERLRDIDEMYLIEARMEIEEEWEHWEDEQRRLPAKIEIINLKEDDTSGDLQNRTKEVSE